MKSRIRVSTVIRVGLATAVLSLISTAVPVRSSAVENGGVGGRPAYPQEGNDRSQSIFLHTLDKGQSVAEGVKLFNNTDSAKTIEVYAVDALISSGGAFSCEQKADPRDNIGAWVNLPVTTVALEANQQEIVDFTITVPETADVGEHNACIAIASVEAPSQSSVQGVQLSFRSAIRVAITVPGDIVKSLTLSNLTYEITQDKITATQTLKNDGNVSLDTTIKTSLKNVFGQQIAEQGGEFVALSANETAINHVFERPRWGGWYVIDAEATYSDDTSLSLGQEGGTTKQVTRSITVFIAPSTTIALIYAAIATAIAMSVAYVIYVKKRKKRVIATAKNHVVNDGETLVSVAALHSVSWKKLAKLNKLKAPYSLSPNQSLIIPAAVSKTDSKNKEILHSKETIIMPDKKSDVDASVQKKEPAQSKTPVDTKPVSITVVEDTAIESDKDEEPKRKPIKKTPIKKASASKKTANKVSKTKKSTKTRNSKKQTVKKQAK